MTDNEIMSFEKAMFILRHGSAEGDYKYFEAIDIIEKEVNRQKAEIEKLMHNLEAMAQTMPNMAKAERAEAIKEITERLHCYCQSIINVEWNKKVYPNSWAAAYEEFDEVVDNIKNEMVGDSE